MAFSPSIDPFSDHPLSGPGMIRSTGPAGGVPSIVDQFGKVVPVLNDPAFQPPVDPLTNLVGRADVIQRDIPNVVVQTGWDVGGVRAAIGELVVGLFDTPGQLVDSICADSRVKAAMASLHGSLFGRPITFDVPKRLKGSSAAQEALDDWCECWPRMATEAAMAELDLWSEMLGFGLAPMVWDTSGDLSIPILKPWHPRFVYYHWTYRCFVALTLDGQVPIATGDGTWLMHAPHGEQRGWMRGSMWGVAPWWLARNYGLRDWARWSERHGFPMLLAKTPAAGDPNQIALFQASLAGLGQESVIQIPQGVDAQYSYGLEYLEPSDPAWQGFQQLIDACGMEITLALMSQNLTTEVKEGSFAAARVHGDVKQVRVESKARGWEQTIQRQLARPFCLMNHGDPDLAPVATWDVSPEEDKREKSLTMMSFAQSLNYLRVAGVKLVDPAQLAKQVGIDLGEYEHVDPLQVEAKVAQAGKNVSEDDVGTPASDDDPAPDVPRVVKPGKQKPSKPKPSGQKDDDADAA